MPIGHSDLYDRIKSFGNGLLRKVKALEGFKQTIDTIWFILKRKTLISEKNGFYGGKSSSRNTHLE